jgi:hypothetical protein
MCEWHNIVSKRIGDPEIWECEVEALNEKWGGGGESCGCSEEPDNPVLLEMSNSLTSFLN